jgi:hypothetical protein
VTHKHIGWWLLAALLALLYWLLKHGTVPGAVASTIAGQPAYPPDPVTGCPQFNSSSSVTTPAGDFVLPLVNVTEGITEFPNNPRSASCPIGYQLWHDVSTGGYFCYPSQ